MYDNNFLEAVETVLINEGGYVNDPADPGGETNYGISKRSYPQLNIKNLTKDQAIEIYYKDWWTKHGMVQYSPIIGKKMLDMAVNMGYTRAAKILQQALIDYFMDYDLFGDYGVDGKIGDLTKKYLAEVKYPEVLLHFMRQNQIEYYKVLIQNKPTFKKYKNGWFRRAVNT